MSYSHAEHILTCCCALVIGKVLLRKTKAVSGDVKLNIQAEKYEISSGQSYNSIIKFLHLISCTNLINAALRGNESWKYNEFEPPTSQGQYGTVNFV